jgi:hypothetical protein
MIGRDGCGCKFCVGKTGATSRFFLIGTDMGKNPIFGLAPNAARASDAEKSAFEFENALIVLPESLILREFGDGSVRFDYDVADTLSVRDLASAFGAAIAAKV